MKVDDDKPHDQCGIFGIFAPGEEVARLTFFGLLALQHRGQESAGITTSDFKRLHSYKSMGLVNQVFNEAKIKKLQGDLAIGHTRYSTEGSSNLRNAQPIVLSSSMGSFALAHNGNLANYKQLQKSLFGKGHCLNSEVDSEVIARVVAEAPGHNFAQKLVNGIPKLRGAFSLIFLTRSKLYVVRDQWGVRPLVLGRINSSGWLVASETTAIESIGGRVVREVKPGEFVQLSKTGLKSFYQLKNNNEGFCIFEYVYFSRPDSVINNQLVQLVRINAGKILAREHLARADFVISVPDSGTSAALGFSQQSGLPFTEGLIKSRYIGRTFIQPGQRIRDLGVRIKFSPLSKILVGKNIVLVDDSVVRGTTISKIIKLLKKAGVAKIHLRIASPPFKHTCYLGIDVKRYKELIANYKTVEQIRKSVGADSLGYLSLAGLKKAIGKTNCNFCTGCFTGAYPVS